MAKTDAAEHADAGNNKLGTLRLFHEHTHDVILIPTPSNDSEDPLNWTQGYKYYVVGLSAWAILLATFCSAGPAILIPEMAVTFFGPPGPGFPGAIAKAAYFVTVCALMMGLGNLIWMPLMLKFGRRWVYIIAYFLYAGTAAWCACAQTYGSMLAARVFMGCAAGAAEILGPLTIADIFFVHERGRMMVIYSSTLSAGTTVGSIIAGAITIRETWQAFFWLSCALTGATGVLMIFTLPETMYDRSRIRGTAPAVDDHVPKDVSKDDEWKSQSLDQVATDLGHDRVRSRPNFSKVLRTYPVKTYTQEPVWKLVLRPMALIILPSTLWASLVMAVTIGFLVAVSSNVSVAFSSMYGFATWQIGLTFLSGLIGSFCAVWFGGSLSDMIADRLTRKNNGVREPEMRLPAMAVSLVTGPLSLILYGVGIGHQLHWICAVIGIGLINFTVVQAANISLVYMIDCYRPIAGEVTMAQYTFKSLFGFLLSFYTNPWIEEDGYVVAFGEMAAISGGVFLLSGVFYVYGKALRTKSWQWPIMKALVHWGDDREVGE